MPVFDSGTSFDLTQAPAAAVGARLRYAATGVELVARSTAGIALDSVIGGNFHYKVALTAAVSRQLNTDWDGGVQLIIDDTVTEQRYDMDPLIAAERTRLILAAGGGGGGGVAGPGADSVTLRFNNTDTGVGIPDAAAWISTDLLGGTVVAGVLQTDSLGDVTFMLTAGLTYYAWLQKDGVNSVRAYEFVAVAD